MAKKVLNMTMDVGDHALGSLEPDKLFKDPEVIRFMTACSVIGKDFAVLGCDGLQFHNESKEAPKRSMEDLSYDERVSLAKTIRGTMKERGYESVIFFAISGFEDAAYIHVLESSKIPYQMVKRLSRIGGEKVAQVSYTRPKTKVIALDASDVAMLYKARGSLEIETGRMVKETEVVRILLEKYLKNKGIKL
ncbi:hypothetical protein ES703_87027 [subsurface metagenome]